MPSIPDRRTLLRSGLCLGVVGLLPPARACEFFSGLLRVSHPWTRATAADATTAVLFMRFDEVSESDRLIGVSTPLALGAEMGGPTSGVAVNLPIARGSVVELVEEGLHLRLTGLRQGLQLGREYPLQLEFERGGTLLARLSVDYGRQRFG